MKKLLSIFLLSAMCNVALAQDIHFSQFYENAILRNPALTGIFSGDYKAGVNYRTQWGNLANPFQTAVASVEARKLVNEDAGDFVSFGLTASYDHAGSISFNSLQVYPAINYNKNMEDEHNTYLSLGFAGGYIQRSMDVSKMTLDNQYVNGNFNSANPTGENIGYKTISHFDLSAGVSLNSSMGEDNKVNYYLGAAAYHVTRPREAFNGDEYFIRLSTRWTGNAGMNVVLSEHLGFVMHMNYQFQKPYQEFIIGGLASWKNVPVSTIDVPIAIYAGAFIRLNDAIIPTVKLTYKKYDFIISYDVTTSNIRPTSTVTGGWEFSAFTRGVFAKAIDRTKCPRFEGMEVVGW